MKDPQTSRYCYNTFVKLAKGIPKQDKAFYFVRGLPQNVQFMFYKLHTWKEIQEKFLAAFPIEKDPGALMAKWAALKQGYKETPCALGHRLWVVWKEMGPVGQPQAWREKIKNILHPIM